MSTSDGTAVAGVNYTAVVTNLTFPVGEIISSIGIPIIDDFLVNTDRTVNLFLTNPQPAGGPALGNQSASQLTIINDDCAVSFSSATYSVNEDTGLGAAVTGLPSLLAGSPNDTLVVAVVGLNGRGGVHLQNLGRQLKNTEVAYLCDVDSNVLAKAQMDAAADARPPKAIGDFRRALDDKDVDIVSIATPIIGIRRWRSSR